MLSFRRTIWGLVLFSGAPAGLLGCDHPFMPLGDYEVRMHVNVSTVDGGWPGAFTMVCAPNSNICGARNVDIDSYESDRFVGYTKSGDSPIGFDEFIGPKAQQIGMIRTGQYVGLILEPPRDRQTVDIVFNDLPASRVTLPPFFEIHSPTLNQQIRKSEAPSVRVEWEPFGQEFPVIWRRILIYNGLGNDPCDALDWPILEGEEEDDGSLEIPTEAFPSNLPAEGCDVAIIVQKRTFGTLGAGLQGYIQSNSQDGAKFRLLP